MALTVDEVNLIQDLANDLNTVAMSDMRLDRYYEGSQRLEHLGIAVPPELRRFEMVVNWNRTAVDAVADRLAMKSFYLPGEEVASEALREAWDYNNLDSESHLHHLETMILGRGYVSVGSNEEDPSFPLIRVESPREMSVDIDPRTRRIRAALRLYGQEPGDMQPKYATLMLPDATKWLERGRNGRWAVVDQDDHRLGRVPVVMFLNRRRLGRWHGVSEMADVIPLVDAAARTLTNLQVAGETVAIPKRWVVGASKGDFVDQEGNPIPVWESYMGAIWASGNKEAKVGQFDGADLKNFHGSLDKYADLVSSVTGLPTRYLGQNSVNPAAEGAIRADESRMILNVERKQTTTFGDGWGWVMALEERFRTGEWITGSRIKTEWYDAGTPTKAETADALTKLYAGGQGVLSREGVWDELGWSEARKDRERAYFESESRLAITSLEKDVSEAL